MTTLKALYFTGLFLSSFTAIALTSHLAIAYPIFRSGGFFLFCLVLLAGSVTALIRVSAARNQFRDKYRWHDGLAVNTMLVQGFLLLFVAVLVGIWTAQG